MTETELRVARTQLQGAGRDLALTRVQLEATEGELGLTRSANELMKVGGREGGGGGWERAWGIGDGSWLAR